MDKLPGLEYHVLRADDKEKIELIAEWYFEEWKIPHEKSIQKLQNLNQGNRQVQVMITINNIPVATGGIYNHVGLLDREPKFKIYKHWLALIYTTPEHRNKGFGSLICDFLQVGAAAENLEELYLFTHTAESLYLRLGWEPIQRLTSAGKDIVVMKKKL